MYEQQTKRVEGRWTALASCFGIVVLLTAIYHIKVGGVQQGLEQVDPRVGYCFDVAVSQDGNRIFVAAGQAGLHIFDLEYGRLTYRSTHHEGGYYRNIKFHEGRIYLADSERGLVVLDVAGENPQAEWIQGDSKAMGLHIEGDKAYVAAYQKGLQIFDISQPAEPQLEGSVESGGYAWDVWAQGDHAYVADFIEGLVVFDVSVPAQSYVVATTTWTKQYPTAEIIRGEGTSIFIAASNHGLILVDISDPAQPMLASKYRPLRIGAAEGLVVRDGEVYLTIRSKLELKVGENVLFSTPTIENGIQVLDVGDPFAPVVLGKVAFLGMVEGASVIGDSLIVANGFRGVRLIDISDPAQSFVMDTFERLP